MKSLLTALVGALPEIITAITGALPLIITAILNAIIQAIPQLINAGVQLLTALIGALPTIINAIVAALPQIICAILSAIGGAIPLLVQAGIQLLTSLIRALPTIIGTIVSAIPRIIYGIVRAVMGGVGQMISAGASLVSGLWQGIQSLAGWLWNRVANWVSSIWNGILGFFGIHSPSKQMAWVGDMLVAGLAGAITTRGHKAADAAATMAKDTMDAMGELTNGVNVPIKVSKDLSLPSTDLTPAPVNQTSQTEKETKTGSVDVQGVADATAARILKGLDIKVVLSDGTLVGKLAPKIDQQLSRLSRRANLLAAGV